MSANFLHVTFDTFSILLLISQWPLSTGVTLYNSLGKFIAVNELSAKNKMRKYNTLMQFSLFRSRLISLTFNSSTGFTNLAIQCSIPLCITTPLIIATNRCSMDDIYFIMFVFLPNLTLNSWVDHFAPYVNINSSDSGVTLCDCQAVVFTFSAAKTAVRDGERVPITMIWYWALGLEVETVEMVDTSRLFKILVSEREEEELEKSERIGSAFSNIR